METQDLTTWCREAHCLAVGKGFWGDRVNPSLADDDPTHLSAKIALMHSELSELLEAVREDPADHCGKDGLALSCEEEETADLFLRLADYCGARGIDLGRAATLKHEYNKDRPYMHGRRL